jgi:EmrB/QacA subfamily drug resistance transporter
MIRQAAEIPDSAPALASQAGSDPRRFRALAVIAVAQLMVVLDATVVTIALPSAQRALHISLANRQWVVTAYTLAFGGLLLLGGRVADYLGRKRMFVVSLLGFAGASALAGLSENAAMLFSARALQGALAAVMAPAALSLLTVTFTESHERARAFAVYGATSGGGAAIGLILGGVLTQYASWRWTLLVNTPIAIVAAVFAVRLVSESRAARRGNYDIFGALTATVGLSVLAYGFTRAASGGWEATATLACLGTGAALLIGFVAIEARLRNPLLPLRIMLDRSRGGAYLASLLMGIALFGTFLFLTFYFQLTLHFSAIRTGFAFLPFSVGVVVGAILSARVLPRVGPRMLMTAGFFVAAIGLGLLARISPRGDYMLHVFPAELVASLGMGLVAGQLSAAALLSVNEQDAGVASALVNTTQQTGGALGMALLNTVAASASMNWLTGHRLLPSAPATAIVHGYTTAFSISAALLVAAMAASLLIARGRGSREPALELDAV